MFLIRGIRKLFALPLLWLGQLLGMLKSSAGIGPLTLAWYISGDGAVARLALAQTRLHHGEAAARARAAAWMDRRPRPEIAAVAGLLISETGHLPAARHMLDLGRRLGDDRSGNLDLLEFVLAARSSDADAAADLARAFEARRDLPGSVSRLVHSELMWTAMRDGQFDEARRRARHMLDVEEVPQAEMALWALARRDGDLRRARAHLDRASLPEGHRLYYQVLGSAAIGARADAQEVLAALWQVDPNAAGLAAAFVARKEALG